jgi:hypothetical protein
MADEQVAEHGGFFGIAGQVVEERDAEVLIEGGLAGLDGVKEFRPGNDEEISGDGENGRTNGAGNIGPEGLGERSEGESLGFVLAEDAITGEGAQEAVERGGVGVVRAASCSAVLGLSARWSARHNWAAVRRRNGTAKPIDISMSWTCGGGI